MHATITSEKRNTLFQPRHRFYLFILSLVS